MDDLWDGFLDVIAECAQSTIFWVLCPLWMALLVGGVEGVYWLTQGHWLVP